jgi:serine O-acetyltransferase
LKIFAGLAGLLWHIIAIEISEFNMGKIETFCKVSSLDPVWDTIRKEAEAVKSAEPSMAGFIYSSILSHDTLEEALIHRLAARLQCEEMSDETLRHIMREAITLIPDFGSVLRADLSAVFERDPACRRHIEPLLYFKGFQALQTQRFSHVLWKMKRYDPALMLQSRASASFQVDIHPAVPIGRAVFIDHATGVVVGETAVIEDDVSILHSVTLGGTGKEDGDRHPKIRKGVLIGAGSKILGNIEVGHCSRIAAGSVVLKSVPNAVTVAGVPAKVVGDAPCAEPSHSMDQMLGSDYFDFGAGI